MFAYDGEVSYVHFNALNDLNQTIKTMPVNTSTCKFFLVKMIVGDSEREPPTIYIFIRINLYGFA